jgi:ABC-type branched-subunit amino acid transport system permease subunit
MAPLVGAEYYGEMNLFIFIPLIIAVVVAVIIFGRRSKSGRSGLGNREDSTERPELRGPEQRKHRL